MQPAPHHLPGDHAKDGRRTQSEGRGNEWPKPLDRVKSSGRRSGGDRAAKQLSQVIFVQHRFGRFESAVEAAGNGRGAVEPLVECTGMGLDALVDRLDSTA